MGGERNTNNSQSEIDKMENMDKAIEELIPSHKQTFHTIEYVITVGCYYMVSKKVKLNDACN